MPHPKRFFLNKLPVFDGNYIPLSKSVYTKRIDEAIELILSKQKTSGDGCDGGLYVGLIGVAYMLYHVAESKSFESKREELLSIAVNYLKIALAFSESPRARGDRHYKEMQASFILGNAGVNATACLIYHAIHDEDLVKEHLKKYADAANTCIPLEFLKCGSDELFVGRAGYLCGLLTLTKRLKKEVVSSDVINSLCSSIITSGVEYAKKHHSSAPLMYAYYDTEYLGAAHGLSAILLMLLSFPQYLKSHPQAEKLVKDSVNFFLSLELESGNYPCAMDEVKRRRSDEDELIHWCHGAPGVVYLMAKAYLFWKDEKYLQACLRCGDVTWERGLLRKGPGICHGISGNGYVFLLLYRLTGDNKYLFRAKQFADFMVTSEFKKGARTPDSPYSLYEGLAGAVCFLSDLIEPDKACFPFFDVFI